MPDNLKDKAGSSLVFFLILGIFVGSIFASGILKQIIILGNT